MFSLKSTNVINDFSILLSVVNWEMDLTANDLNRDHDGQSCVFFCDLLRKRGRSFCAFSDDSFNICRSSAFGALRYSMVQHIVHNRRGDAAAKEFDKICERSLANPFVGMKLADHTCFDVGSWFACMICPFRRM